MSDIDKDGMLDIDEWALSQHLSKDQTLHFHVTSFFLLLVKIKLDGHELPNILPEHLVPPSKRHLVTGEGGGSKNPGLYPSIGAGGEQISGDS